MRGGECRQNIHDCPAHGMNRFCVGAEKSKVCMGGGTSGGFTKKEKHQQAMDRIWVGRG